MSFLARVLSILPSKKRRTFNSGAGLQVERLEERWTPAVSITGQGTNAVTINDSSSGQTNNAIEIIDDLDSERTYIKINNGSEQLLGLSDSLLSSLIIHMGTGSDKVKFSTRGSAHTFEHDVARHVDLGSGDDALTINLNPAADVHGYVMDFDITGDTTGNDVYSILGGMKTGQFYFDLFNVDETAGNDVYNIDLAATNSAQVQIRIDDLTGNDRYTSKLSSHDNSSAVQAYVSDLAGNDSYSVTNTANNTTGIVGASLRNYQGNDAYSLAFGASTNALELNAQIVDQGTGKNKVITTQAGLYSTLLNVEFDFNTSPSSNSINIGGSSVVDHSTVHYAINTGDGADSISIDDNLLQLETFVGYDVHTGGGNDSVSLKFDGAPKVGFAAMGPDTAATTSIDLGAGNDSFTASFVAKDWVLTTADMGSASFVLDVLGGVGNDKLATKTDGKLLQIVGAHAFFGITLDGQAGNDSIDVNLGSTGGFGLSPVTISLAFYGGEGSDKVSFAGTVKVDDPDLTFHVYVDLGVDTVKDSFKSTFKYAALPMLSTFNGEIHHAFVGEDQVSVSNSSTAPDWTGIA